MKSSQRLSDIIEAKVISLAFERVRAQSPVEALGVDSKMHSYVNLMTHSPERRKLLVGVYNSYVGIEAPQVTGA